MKNYFKLIFHVSFFLVISSSQAANFINPPGEPSNLFDGEYIFSHKCFNKSDGKPYKGNYYDGSKFIIKEGLVSNNQDGAGKYSVFEDSRVDKNGKITVKGKRASKNFNIIGKFSKDFKNQSSKFKGKVSRANKSLSKGHPCVITFTRTGDVKKNKPLNKNQSFLEIKFSSKNTNDEITLLNEDGVNIEIMAKLRNINKIKNGLIIVVPSSTPNMEDEYIYERQLKDLEKTTAIIFGAGPRYKKKYGSTFTSSMIMYDIIALIRKLKKLYSEPKEIVLVGSSTGALAIFKAAWEIYREKYPSIKKITKVLMINAACPDTFEGQLSEKVNIYTINGKIDDSTPGWICKKLKESKNYQNIINLEYEGGHHFESDRYEKTHFGGGMHALPTCSINYKSNLYQIIKLRDGSGQWDTEAKGFRKDQKDWFGSNCVKKGHYQGYEEVGAKSFWADAKDIIAKNEKRVKLRGYK